MVVTCTTTPSGLVALMLPWTVAGELRVGLTWLGSSTQAKWAASHPTMATPPLPTMMLPFTVKPDVVDGAPALRA